MAASLVRDPSGHVSAADSGKLIALDRLRRCGLGVAVLTAAELFSGNGTGGNDVEDAIGEVQRPALVRLGDLL